LRPFLRAGPFNMSFDPETLRGVAHQMADAARAAILPYFRRPDLVADNKDASDFDPVTEADRAAERAMREVLAKLRPDDGILGEEYGTTTGRSGLTWVLDPIDGTRGFISGMPTWGVLIALQDTSGPIFGIIDQPYIKERFEGGFGHARVVGPHGEAHLKTSSVCKIKEATILSTFPEVGDEVERAAFHTLAKQTKLTRYGMDCYGYALLAAGHVDLVVEAQLNAYDIAAPIAVIQAAGGLVTDWTGAPAHHGGRVLAAATPELHKAALADLMASSE